MRPETLPPLRLGLDQAAQILNTTRATLYCRIRDGALKAHKDGRRTYLTMAEVKRYAKRAENGKGR
jgi:excisionase family DNA binding protein